MIKCMRPRIARFGNVCISPHPSLRGRRPWQSMAFETAGRHVAAPRPDEMRLQRLLGPCIYKSIQLNLGARGGLNVADLGAQTR